MRTPSPGAEKRTWWCLNEVQLASYVDGVLSGWGRRRVERHLATCERCRREVSLLVQSQREPSQSVPPEWLARVRGLGEQSTIGRSWRWTPAGATVAALACSLILGTWLVAHLHRGVSTLAKTVVTGAVAPTVSSQGTDEVRELGKSTAGPIVMAPAAGATVTRGFDIRWQQVPTAVSYDLRILNADGDTVWRVQTMGQSFHMPDTVPADDDKDYFLIITANLSSGKTVRAKSVTFRVQKK